MQAMGMSHKRWRLKAFPWTVSKLVTSNIFQVGNFERTCWFHLKQKIEPVAVKFNHSGYTFGKIPNVDPNLCCFCGVLAQQTTARKRERKKTHLFWSIREVRGRKLWAHEGDRHWDKGIPAPIILSTHYSQLCLRVHSGVCKSVVYVDRIFWFFFQEETRNTLTAQHRRPAFSTSVVSDVVTKFLHVAVPSSIHPWTEC